MRHLPTSQHHLDNNSNSTREDPQNSSTYDPPSLDASTHSQAFWRSPPHSRRSLPCNPASLSSAFWDPRGRATKKACLGRQVGACGALNPCIWTSRAERASARVELHSGKPFCSGFGISQDCSRCNSPNWDRTHRRLFHRAQNDLQLSWSSGLALAAASTTGLLNKPWQACFIASPSLPWDNRPTCVLTCITVIVTARLSPLSHC